MRILSPARLPGVGMACPPSGPGLRGLPGKAWNHYTTAAWVVQQSVIRHRQNRRPSEPQRAPVALFLFVFIFFLVLSFSFMRLGPLVGMDYASFTLRQTRRVHTAMLSPCFCPPLAVGLLFVLIFCLILSFFIALRPRRPILSAARKDARPYFFAASGGVTFYFHLLFDTQLFYCAQAARAVPFCRQKGTKATHPSAPSGRCSEDLLAQRSKPAAAIAAPAGFGYRKRCQGEPFRWVPLWNPLLTDQRQHFRPPPVADGGRKWWAQRSASRGARLRTSGSRAPQEKAPLWNPSCIYRRR